MSRLNMITLTSGIHVGDTIRKRYGKFVVLKLSGKNHLENSQVPRLTNECSDYLAASNNCESSH